LVGSPQANIYLRARWALFAFNKTETIYYNADVDDNGDPLTGDSDYLIE